MKSRLSGLLCWSALRWLLILMASLSQALAGSQIVAWGDLNQSSVPAGATGIVAVAAAHFHNLSLNANGTLTAWPVQPVNPTDPASHLPVGLTNVVRMAGGVTHDLALRVDGTVVAWGDNTYGQTVVPDFGPGLGGVVAITAGGYHSLALGLDGSVTAWGDNSYGQCTVPGTATNVVAIAAGFYHSVALLANGTVVGWGDDSFGQTDVPVSLTNAIAVSAGGDHCLALTAAGSVVAWGDNSYGQTSVPSDLTNAVAVAAGDYHSLALRGDGTVVAWGPPLESATEVPMGVSNVIAIAAGGSHNLALVQTGGPVPTLPMTFQIVPAGSSITLSSGLAQSVALACQWSFNGTPLTGATNAELTLQNAQTNQTGTYSLVASNAFGLLTMTATVLTIIPTVILSPPQSQTSFVNATVNLSVTFVSTVPVTYQWSFNGTNLPGATGPSLSLAQIAPDQQGNYSVALSNLYGTVVSPGANISVTSLVAWYAGSRSSFGMNLGDVVSLTRTRNDHVQAVRADGTVAGWAPPGNPTNIVAVANGYEHAIALRAEGTVLAWGDNYDGQTNVPPDLTNAIAIACGDFHNLALRADGSVSAWGDDHDYFGATDVPSYLANVVGIAAGTWDSLALTSDGQLFFWGTLYLANRGLFTVPPGLTNVVAVAAGDSHFLAGRNDGTVVAWGDNSYGQTNVPPDLTNVVAIAADGNESLAVTAGGTVIGWGSASGLPANVVALSNVVAIAAGSEFNSFNLALIGSGPPHLTAPLVSRQVALGATTSFRAVAAGLFPFAYQWQFQGTDLPGATNSLLTLTNVQPQQAGSYSVMVSNASGVVTSESASLNVAPVLIDAVIAQPSRLLAYGAENVSFSAVAQGLNLNYQWLTNDVPIVGATNSTLTFSNVQLSQAAAYSVTVSNPFGSATSPNANLEVVPVWIQGQPRSQTNYPGAQVTLSATVVGVQPLSYQWSFNGTNLPGATNFSLSFLSLDPVQSGTYLLTISNIYGVVATQPANLAVLNLAEWQNSLTNPPSFTSVPSDVISLAASSAGWCLGLNADGTVISVPTPSAPAPQIPADLTNAIAIAAGWLHGLALRADGTVLAWGDNRLGQTNIPAGLAGVVSIVAAGSHNLALKSDGTVVGWGDNSFGQTDIPVGLTNIAAIAAGTNGSLALSRDGHVYGWGADDQGRPLSLPPDLTNLVAIATRDSMLLGIRDDGSLAVWQTNPAGPPYVPPGPSNLVEIAANPGLDLELADDGTVSSWAVPTNTTAAVANVVAIAVGGGTAFALLGSGPALVPVLLDNALYDTNGFSVPVPTQSGRVYSLEYKDSLAENQWKPLPLSAGTGNLLTLRDTTATGAARFYCVRRW